MVGDNSHDMETARAGGAGSPSRSLSGNSATTTLRISPITSLPSIAGLPDLLRTL